MVEMKKKGGNEMTKTEKVAKSMYEMMSAMYKPVEKKMLDDAKKVKPDFINSYKKFSYMKKICVLDAYASKVLGL